MNKDVTKDAAVSYFIHLPPWQQWFLQSIIMSLLLIFLYVGLYQRAAHRLENKVSEVKILRESGIERVSQEQIEKYKSAYQRLNTNLKGVMNAQLGLANCLEVFDCADKLDLQVRQYEPDKIPFIVRGRLDNLLRFIREFHFAVKLGWQTIKITPVVTEHGAVKDLVYKMEIKIARQK